MKYSFIATLFFVITFLFSGCTQPTTESDSKIDTTMTETNLDNLSSKLASDQRSETDRARDTGRKPAEAMSFIGIESGMNVIDLVAATGWYSEVLSIAVGPSGSVTAQNPPFMAAFRNGTYLDGLTERIGDRLENVFRLDGTWEELAASKVQYDAAWSALNIHDVYYMEGPEKASIFASAVFSVLKPGGVLGIIEHSGNPDGDNEALHRLDPALAIEIVTGAGFILEDESDLFNNPEDDGTKGVFSDGLRGNTNRFFLKFRKPSI